MKKILLSFLCLTGLMFSAAAQTPAGGITLSTLQPGDLIPVLRLDSNSNWVYRAVPNGGFTSTGGTFTVSYSGLVLQTNTLTITNQPLSGSTDFGYTNGLIPIMSGNSSGLINQFSITGTASADNGSSVAWSAFNPVCECFFEESGVKGGHVQFQFDQPVTVNQFYGTFSQTVKTTVAYQSSSDGSVWNTYLTVTNVGNGTENLTNNFPPVAATYFRWVFASASNEVWTASAFQLWPPVTNGTLSTVTLSAGTNSLGGTNASQLNITTGAKFTGPVDATAYTIGGVPVSSNGGAAVSATNAPNGTPLNNLSLVQTNFSFVNNFVNGNHLSGASIGYLQGAINRLVLLNQLTNLVDAILLKPYFNPSNQLSLFGNPFTWPNQSFGAPTNFAQNWGAHITGNSTVTFPLPAMLTNGYTIAVCYRQDFTFNNPVSGGVVYKLFDTNSQNADTFAYFGGNPYGVFNTISGANVVGQPYNLSTSVFNNGGGTNWFFPLTVSGYQNGKPEAYQQATAVERRVVVIQKSVSGLVSISEDMMPMDPNYFQLPGLSLWPVTNYQCAFLSSNLNTLAIGQDVSVTNLPAVDYQDGTTNFYVDSVWIFNGTNKATAIAANQAADWVEPDTTYDVFIGDSRWETDTAYPNNQPIVNSVPIQAEYLKKTQSCFRCLTLGGSQLQYVSTYFMPMGGWDFLTNLPPDKFTVDFKNEEKFNDIQSGTSLSTLGGYMTNAYNPLLALPFFKLSDVEAGQPGLQSSVYTAALVTNIASGNLYFWTNVPGFWSRQYHVSQFYTDWLLDTNNGFSPDGQHYNGTNNVINNDLASVIVNGEAAWTPPTNFFAH